MLPTKVKHLTRSRGSFGSVGCSNLTLRVKLRNLLPKASQFTVGQNLKTRVDYIPCDLRTRTRISVVDLRMGDRVSVINFQS